MSLYCNFLLSLCGVSEEGKEARNQEKESKESNKSLTPCILKKERCYKATDSCSKSLVSSKQSKCFFSLSFESSSKENIDHCIKVTLQKSNKSRGEEPDQVKGTRERS